VNRGKILDQVQRMGYKFEEEHHGCAQCTLLALQEVFDQKNEELFKALSGFGFGIARMYSVCGALIAGGLFLGTKYGRGYADLKEPQDIKIAKLRVAYEPVGKLYKWVEREFGSVTCLISSSSLPLTILNSQGWVFAQEGERKPSSIISFRSFWGTASGLKARILFL